MNEVVCPKCGCKTVVKKGMRKTRFGVVQRYLCKRCSRYFADKPLPRCTYHPRIIYHALNHYNMGCSLQKTRSLVNKQFKINVGKTTIHSWITKYQSICPILSIRKQYKDAEDVIFKKRFEHENLSYEFMYHQYKLQRYASRRFPGLFKYICGFESGCPDEFFEIGERCSKPKFKVDVKVRVHVNLACRMADFAVLRIDLYPPDISVGGGRNGSSSQCGVFASIWEIGSGEDRVEFYIDDELMFTDYAYPFEWIYENPNSHTVMATVYDKAGLNASDGIFIPESFPIVARGLIYNPEFFEQGVTLFSLLGRINYGGIRMFERLTFPIDYEGYIGRFFIRITLKV